MAQIPFTEKYYVKGDSAYTEDYVVIKSLFFLVNDEKDLKEQKFKTYFEGFGRVERLQLFPSESRPEFMRLYDATGTRTGYVRYAKSRDAAKALFFPFHEFGGTRVIVGPRYSWHQPDAEKMPQGPEIVDPNEPAAGIMKLNTYCLEHIIKHLSPGDAIRMARTCFRFRSAFEGISKSMHKSINCDLFKEMTVWNLRDFFQLAGRNIREIEGTVPKSKTLHIFRYLGKHCINLQSLSIWNNSFTDEVDNVFEVFVNLKSLQALELYNCDLADKHLSALKHLGQLKKLNLSKNNTLSGRNMNLLPKSIESLRLSGCYRLMPKLTSEMLAKLPLLKELHLDGMLKNPSTLPFNLKDCKSLEILTISYIEGFFEGYKHIALLPNLKKLSLKIKHEDGSITPNLFRSLMANKSEQLEHLEIFNADSLNDDGLKSLYALQELREIQLKTTRNITDNGVIGLILACPKLQVLHLERCKQLTDKLLFEIIRKLKDNGNQRPLPIKLYMTGIKISQDSLLNADVAAKNIIDVIYKDK